MIDFRGRKGRRVETLRRGGVPSPEPHPLTSSHLSPKRRDDTLLPSRRYASVAGPVHPICYPWSWPCVCLSVCPSVCLSVCLSVISRYCVDSAGRIDLVFGTEAGLGLYYIVLEGHSGFFKRYVVPNSSHLPWLSRTSVKRRAGSSAKAESIIRVRR